LKEAEFDWPVNVVISEPSEELLLKALREGPYGCCVYHCDNDVVDHQVVNVEFEDGLTLNFTMCAFTAHGGRTLRVMGTHGELTGDMKKNIINVMPFVGKETEIDVTKLTDDFSGHSGGDMQMINEFVQLLAGQSLPSQTLSSIDYSVESHLIALAAEQSRRGNGCVIEIER
ncbi:MAG: gfo/Idh/MocA family oxidoreductase, partial [Clostridia bacterium]